ncbi:hypothetical protein HDV05_004832 [Chytridiales sp. JEL 0842]|nr:hypothetical protein HDV05_004832 [Chytridiales sp. JEL 0842]
MVRPGRTNPFSSAAVAEAAVGGDIYDDMAAACLPPKTQPLTVEDIVSNLRARMANNLPYTRIGGRVLVALNPAKPALLPSDAQSKAHAAHARSTNPAKAQSSELPGAHLFDLSASAYYHMARGQEDQAILLVGESGSGKTESMKAITRNLCDLSKPTKKKTKVQSAILKVDSVFGAFGNACTARNKDASCFTRYTEYQFDERGRMVGAKYIDYLLEKSRVTGSEDGGRNFNIFYYLLAGATHEEKQQWQLGDPAHYHYLTVSSIRAAFPEDETALGELRENLKDLGVGRRQQAQLYQLLAAILHLGNITFMDDPNKSDEPCTVKNYPQLAVVADLLGVHPATLETTLTYKTQVIRKDTVSVFLDSKAAAEQRDSLARSLYAVAFSFIVEQINNKLCKPETEWTNFVAILDAPGFGSNGTIGASQAEGFVGQNGFHRLLVNYANEKIQDFVGAQLFDLPRDVLIAEGLEPPAQRPQTSDALNLLEGSNGILPILDSESARGTKDSKATEKLHAEHSSSPAFVAGPSSTAATAAGKRSKHLFAIRHTLGTVVEYDTKGLADRNLDVLQSDFVNLIRGSPEQPGTSSPFLRGLFSDRMISTLTHARDGSTVVAAIAKSRFPSLKRNKRSSSHNEEHHVDPSATVGHKFRTSFGELLDTLRDTQTWFCLNIKQSDDLATLSKFDPAVVQRQVTALQLPLIAQNPAVLYTAALKHSSLIERFSGVLGPLGVSRYGDAKSQCESLIRGSSWTTAQARNGKTRMFMAEKEWRSFEDRLRAQEDAERAKNGGDTGSVYSWGGYAESDAGSNAGDVRSRGGKAKVGDDDFAGSETESHFESEFGDVPKGGDVPMDALKMGNIPNGGDMKGVEGGEMTKGGKGKKVAPPPKKPMTNARFRWLLCVWCGTWWVPSFCLKMCKMPRRERQMAWREKLALCLIIFLMNALILFFIVGLSFILCPKERVKSPGEITSYNSLGRNRALVTVYGRYYTVTDIFNTHVGNGANAKPAVWENIVLGLDVSQMFDRSQYWGSYCPIPKPNDFILYPNQNPNFLDGKWYLHRNDVGNQLSPYVRGTVVWDPTTIQNYLKDSNNRLIIAYDRVYDVSPFYNGNYKANFLGDLFKQSFDFWSLRGGDATEDFEFIRKNNMTQFERAMPCMDSIFFAGRVDHRQDLRCVVPNYILLAASCILVLVIGFKFIAALQLGTKRSPEDHDKFVICQVPCYTEGESSLVKTIQSLATLDYDDKHKLLFIIADGMIIGSGNDRPTPRIVLDILGVDPAVDPESLSFHSLGEGPKQHNMGKVYSGLYEVMGHVVPYVVVVKVGKPNERHRPGNRGKRDSQMILMRFLSRVHFNQEMTPLELELYHQMKNVIGVDPSFYEFILSIDADTEVFPDSLNRLVANMARDSKIIGICGETQLTNEKDSWVTMIQVYEYFISHHLAKAFESLFGSVTCLPGCFSMFRIRTPVKNIPLLVSPGIVNDYAENEVDTLHLKNLLHLGEDRYLTTLLLKHFPAMRTTFTSDAKCRTNAPERWNVFLSQRRRWINSTVHNLLELIYLPELCGFCCFNMRFVVFVDLLATLVQPAAILYIVYLVYAALTDETTTFPLISIIMIGAIYGFQIIIFLLKGEWQHIGWMIIYIFALPFYTFYIPLYAFWHMDDFSWGNTRIVVEDGQKKEVAVDPEPFDPSEIPMKKWADYELERLEKADTYSEASFQTKSKSVLPGVPQLLPPHAGSVYGGGSVYGAPVMPMAPSTYAPSAYGGPVAPMIPPSPGSVYGAPEGSVYGYPPAPMGIAPSVAGSHRMSWMTNPQSTRGGFPSDEEILMQIRHILSTADLMTVTRKSVREELGRVFGVDLSSRKDYIHSCIDGILRGDL